jgi:hypothetical protein
MEQLKDLSHGAKIVLGAAIAFLVVSFFNWFEVEGLEEATGIEAGVSMWHGVGWLAGLLAIGLIVWQALRLANIQLEVGVTPAMITAALAVLVLVFTFIRFIDAPTLLERTFWAWIGLILAIVVVVGAWMNMTAAGESLQGVMDRFGTKSDAPAAPAATPDPPVSTPEPPDADRPAG